MKDEKSLQQEEKSFQHLERLLVVCTGNTCRSPMAAALARKYLPWVEVISAGTATTPGLPASVGAMDAMQQLGLSIDDHQSRQVNKYLLAEADLVLTMTQRQKEVIVDYMNDIADKVFTLGEFTGLCQDIPDPFGLSVQRYVVCAKRLDGLMQKVAEICTPPQEE